MSKKRANPLPDDQGRRPTVVALKGTPEWKGWLERLAKHCRMKTSVVIDQTLVKYAKDQGFDEPPPER